MLNGGDKVKIKNPSTQIPPLWKVGEGEITRFAGMSFDNRQMFGVTFNNGESEWFLFEDELKKVEGVKK